MKKNQKKIVGTLLGLIASISGTNAMQNGSAKDNGIENSAGNTKNQNDESKVLKKRGQAEANPYLKAVGFVLKAILVNDFASTIPGAGKYFRPLIRPFVSNYRVVHGFRGYINRHDNPLYKNVFKLAGDDGNDFRVRVDKGDNWFKWRDLKLDNIQDFVDELYTMKIAKIEDNINAIPARNKNEEKKEEKKKMKLSEYLSEPYVNLVAEAKVKGQGVYYRLFDEYASIWSIDDAAKAVGKANELLDIINNEKMSKEEKKNAILKKFGKNVVFVPSNLKDKSTIFRIFLKKSKMKLNNVDDLAEKIAKEKLLAGKLGDLEFENEIGAINEEKGKIKNSLSQLEQLNGVVDVNCYVEFKIV